MSRTPILDRGGEDLADGVHLEVLDVPVSVPQLVHGQPDRTEWTQGPAPPSRIEQKARCRRPDAALGEVVDGGGFSARDKAAAILVLVFCQQIEKVVALGDFAIGLNDPLDAPWRDLMANPGHGQTAAHPNSNWVFGGHSLGQHINSMSLRDRLRRRIFSTRAARLSTLNELAKVAPVAIIAEARLQPEDHRDSRHRVRCRLRQIRRRRGDQRQMSSRQPSAVRLGCLPCRSASCISAALV